MQYILLAFSGERLHPWHDTPLTIWLSKRLYNPMIAPTKKRLAQAFPIYELKITLCGSNPAIRRRVQVPGGIKLNRLHDVLQVVMGWTDSHLHQFRVGSVIYCLPSDDAFYPGGEQRDERRFRLADIAQREKTPLIYEYDFGDRWEHEVVVEKVLAADSEKKCAVCLDGKNARPPEDCGGIFGYYDLLKAINNPKHAEHQQLLDWLGGPFDPSHVPLCAVHKQTLHSDGIEFRVYIREKRTAL